jgi:hypothetical protein
MRPTMSQPLRCADCGNTISGRPIVLSARESLCEDCWPFFLKPLTEEEIQRRRGRGYSRAKKSA